MLSAKICGLHNGAVCISLMFQILDEYVVECDTFMIDVCVCLHGVQSRPSELKVRRCDQFRM